MKKINAFVAAGLLGLLAGATLIRAATIIAPANITVTPAQVLTALQVTDPNFTVIPSSFSFMNPGEGLKGTSSMTGLFVHTYVATDTGEIKFFLTKGQ